MDFNNMNQIPPNMIPGGFPGGSKKKEDEGWKKPAAVILLYSLIAESMSTIWLLIYLNSQARASGFPLAILWYLLLCVTAGIAATAITFHIYIMRRILKKKK